MELRPHCDFIVMFHLFVLGDYKELQGEWIPFKKLGYPTLEKLFLDVPGFKTTQVNGEWHVDAIASQETQHIAAMVARQKPSKKASIKLNYNVSKYLFNLSSLYYTYFF